MSVGKIQMFTDVRWVGFHPLQKKLAWEKHSSLFFRTIIDDDNKSFLTSRRQVTDRMEPIHKKFTDFLMTKRLQTLQSIDEAVERVCL
jgi:hypothetical protein